MPNIQIYTANNESQKLHHRCTKCNKLLGIEKKKEDIFEIKCNRCGEINSLLGDKNKQIFLTDAKGFIVYINDKVESVTGYSKEEVMGKTPALWGGQMSDAFYADFWNTILTQKKAVSVRLVNKRKDNSLYNVSMQISPILNSYGDVEFFLAMETVIENNDLKSL